MISWIEDGSITSVPGFRAAGVACGIKKNDALDLALVASDVPCHAAAVFTQNRVKAAPVIYDQDVLAAHADRVSAVVINSGNANACTGGRGTADTQTMADETARALGVASDEVMVMSTGVIGEYLDMQAVTSGIRSAADQLSPAGGEAVARAIMTTDTRPKTAALSIVARDEEFVLAGMAKGSGMIHPNMATMLCLLVTDLPVRSDVLQGILTRAVEQTFNRISVDGDTSTNDTVLLLSRSNPTVDVIADESDLRVVGFARALEMVCRKLAVAIVRDGEGASHLVELVVEAARDKEMADQVADSVMRSPLVKTAIFGRDANWGRIVMATGASGADINPDRLDVSIGNVLVCRGCQSVEANEAALQALLDQEEVHITIRLGLGDYTGRYWTCDLTDEYVSINADYRS